MLDLPALLSARKLVVGSGAFALAACLFAGSAGRQLAVTLTVYRSATVGNKDWRAWRRLMALTLTLASRPDGKDVRSRTRTGG